MESTVVRELMPVGKLIPKLIELALKEVNAQ